MAASLEKAFGYQGNHLALPVPSLDTAIPFYEKVLSVRVESLGETPHKSALLARDRVRIGLAENGGDPTQDGTAFHVNGLDDLLAEFAAKGLENDASAIGVEQRNDGA